MSGIAAPPPLPHAEIGDGIALRPELDADRSFARSLYAAQRAAELAAVPWDAGMKSAFIDQQFAAQMAHLRAHRPDADYWIVLRAGAAIGRMYVDRTVDPWRLAELSLAPEQVGAGVGATLLRWLIERARGDGASGVDLHVAIDNIRGAEFYARNGFVETRSDFESHRRMHHLFGASQAKTAS